MREIAPKRLHPSKESAAMPLDASTEITPAAAVQARPLRRPFAPPSREGMLICAASLMPAYLFGLVGLLSAVNLVAAMQAGPAADPQGTATGWLHLGHRALTATFSVLVCWLFLIRRPSTQSRGAGGWISDAAAVALAGTGVVLGISNAPRTVDNRIVLAAAEVLMTIGLIAMVVGLASLGRSFGIMPRARGLVQTGLYRWIRHPIYLGELLTFAGVVILAISPWTLAAYALFVILQGYRLVMEERTLLQAYPEYADYRARTARLLPGVY
jgi:protein-S-isoprenylcysteine O-methyltransferase Ste14